MTPSHIIHPSNRRSHAVRRAQRSRLSHLWGAAAAHTKPAHADPTTTCYPLSHLGCNVMISARNARGGLECVLKSTVAERGACLILTGTSKRGMGDTTGNSEARSGQNHGVEATCNGLVQYFHESTNSFPRTESWK